MSKPIVKKSSMNKTELAYSQNLELKKRAGYIIDWRFNAIRFRLGSGAYYKPDFLVVKVDCFELHETKGFMREAANVRIKTAAELYPWFRWIVVRATPAGWDFKEVK